MTDALPPDDDALGELLRKAWRDEAPPAAARARVLALHDPAPRLERGAAALRRLVAVLVSGGDAAPFAPAFGVRGAAGRQWLFRAGACEIDLRVSASAHDQRWTMAGQLFGAPGAQRIALGGAGFQAHVALEATREFVFAGLPAGRYSLTVEGGEVDVVVPDVDIGQPTGA
jgi:hypothetical protein